MFPDMRSNGHSGSATFWTVFALGACGVTAACSKSDTQGAAASAAPSGGGAAAAAPSSAVRVRPVVLTAEPEKVWASGVSLATGLTLTELDAGRIAVGAESGRGPVVVAYDSKGEGHEAHIGVKKELTAELKKEDGKREILRVTPALGSGGEVVAFVDYREIGDARRLVACGPSDSPDEILKFEGKPLIDASDELGEKGKAEEAAKPAPAASAGSKGAAVPAKPAPPPSGAKPAPTPPKPVAPLSSGAKPAPAKPAARPPVIPPSIDKAAKPASSAKPPAKPSEVPAKSEPQRELRECRTLVDRGGAHAWAVGSELVGKPAADGSVEYSIVIFTEQERGRGRADLSTSPIGKNPTKIPVYEAATVFDMGGGSFALAARFRGSLFAWVLDASKHAKGPARVYGGGYPAQPHFANLGSEQLLILVQAGAGQKSARAARFAPDVTSLPSALSDFVIPDHAIEPPVSAAVVPAPSVLAGQRFIAYQSDESAKRLSVVQIDGNFAATGEPLAVDVGVRDSELVALADGRLLVVYLRVDASGKSELVSKTIRLG